MFPRIHTLTRDDSSLRCKVYSRHDPFRSSTASSSSVKKNCPFSMFFEKPALEQSCEFLLAFSQQVSLYFGISLRNSAEQWEILSVFTIVSKSSFAASFPATSESLDNSLRESAANWIELMDNLWNSSGRSSQDPQQWECSMRFNR